MTCTADSAHTVTLAEANAGNVQNVATVTGDPPASPAVKDTSTLDTPVVQNAALSISKSANPLTLQYPGQSHRLHFHCHQLRRCDYFRSDHH